MRAVLLLVLATTPAAAQAPDAARARVLALVSSGQYGDALSQAQRHGLRVLEGDVRLLRGEWDAAAAAYTAALEDRAPDSLAARYGLARVAQLQGRLEEARARFDAFIDVYNDAPRPLTSQELTVVAHAVRSLSVWNSALAHDALRAYDEAAAEDPANLDARLGAGELFLERYAAGEAAEAFRDVLERAPDHPRALLGLARTHRFANQPDAAALTERALAANPSLVEGRTFLARLHLEREDYAAAEDEVRRALAVNPASLEALAVLTAVRLLADDTAGYQALSRRVLERNPHFAALFITLAEAAARNRRYADAVRFAGQGVALDSSSWRNWALMGINQLRVGAIADGRASLERAFAGDPFDLWTKNTLDLLDTLVTYPEAASPRFRILADAGEAEALALYMTPLAEEAWTTFAVRYGHEPARPVRVEVFPTHADFSVRTVGLAGLGALGVSFGPVIAMDSPSARDRGAFNWGSTLWHEIAHTFHLDLSRHRVPRWFTEGLAVYEERRARQGWGDNVSPGFLLAWRQGRLHPVSRLNDGFLRPAYPAQLSYSYYQASLVAELLEDTYGEGVLRRILVAYGEGLDTPAVFAGVLGTSPEDFDRTFDRWIEKRFSHPLAALADADTATQDAQRLAQAARRNPGDYLAQLRMGYFMLREGRSDAAIEFLERARALIPEYAGADSPYPALARLYEGRGAWDKLMTILAAWTAIDESAWDAHLQLARQRERAGDTVGATAALEAAMYITPLDLSAHEYLAELYRGLARHDREVRERKAVLALRPTDRAAAWYRLSRAHLAAGESADARRAVLRALERAPGYPEAQELLLEIVERGGSR